MVTNFEIQKYGSNQLRKKLNYIPKMDQSAGRLQEPIVRGRNYRMRTSKKHKSQEKTKKGEKGKIRRGQVKLDSYNLND